MALAFLQVAVPYVAMVLTEVFTGGPEISLRVKEEQIERIFHLIADGREGSPDLLHTLQSMVKVSVAYPRRVGVGNVSMGDR